jgi:hypothetical protein
VTEIHLCIELFDQRQSTEVLDLLYFPAGPLRPGKSRLTINRFELQNKWTWKGPNIADFIDAAQNEQQNRITVKSVFKPTVLGDGLRVTHVSSELDISPTTSLWAASPKDAEFDRLLLQLNRERFDRIEAAQNEELRLKENRITAWPAVLTAEIRIVCDKDYVDEDVSMLLGKALAESIPDSFMREGLSGGAGHTGGRNEEYAPAIRERLGKWIKAIPMLGEKFGAVCQYLIGPLASCRGLADALANERIEVFAARSDKKPFPIGVLYIPADLIRHQVRSETHGFSAEQLERLQMGEQVIAGMRYLAPIWRWMVTRDETTKSYEFGSEDGEYYLDNSYYTLRKYQEMQAEGRFRPLSLGCDYRPVVANKYCELLGIDVQQMLVRWNHPNNRSVLEAAVDQYYNELPENMPLGKRIWKAHERIWLAGGAGNVMSRVSGRFIEFMRTTYFPDID